MRNGYTLIEVIVVLVLMAVAAALVAPALAPRHDAKSAISELITHARAMAIRRAEAVELRIGPSGVWRLDGLASTDAGPIATGTVSPGPSAQLTLIFSPLGSCAPDVTTAAAAASLRLDPLTCEGVP